MQFFFILVASDGLYYSLHITNVFSMITSYYRCTHILYLFSLHLSLTSCFGNHLMEMLTFLQLIFYLHVHSLLGCFVESLSSPHLPDTNALFCTVPLLFSPLLVNCERNSLKPRLDKRLMRAGDWTHDLLRLKPMRSPLCHGAPDSVVTYMFSIILFHLSYFITI